MKNGKKVLHLMIDDKFIDYFITQSEEVCPEVSTYCVVKEKAADDLNRVRSDKAIAVKWSKSTIEELGKAANDYDTIVLHSFFFDNLLSFVKKIKKDKTIVWVFWGGDGYAYSMNQKRWYLPYTSEYRKEKLAQNVGLLRKTYSGFKLGYLRFKEAHAIRQLIKRVNVCATWVKHDFEMISAVNKKMKWKYYSYFTTTDIGFSFIDNIRHSIPDYSNIWIGNSATDTNNHLDALQFLKRMGWAGKIFVPLSYGDTAYRDDIMNFGQKNFGQQFFPITGYLPLEKYYELMNVCGFIWMNHIRQQAAGNTLAAIYMQKAVIMNGNNNLYKTLKEWGVEFARLEALHDPSIVDNSLFEKNTAILRKRLSSEENLKALAAIYNN